MRAQSCGRLHVRHRRRRIRWIYRQQTVLAEIALHGVRPSARIRVKMVPIIAEGRSQHELRCASAALERREKPPREIWRKPLVVLCIDPEHRRVRVLAEGMQCAFDAALVADAERLCVEAARTRGAYPNVDLALAALILAADLDPDCGEVIFTLARTIGLAAHAMEEYPHGLRLRPRAMASQAGPG